MLEQIAHMNLFSAHLGALIEHEWQNKIRTWENLYRERQEIHRIHRWMIQRFPHSSAECLAASPGYGVIPRSDAYSMACCRNTTDYTAYFNRNYNGTCYSDFPVIVHFPNTPKFLQITDRRLQSHSVPIPCDQIPKTTYLEDINESIWMISRDGTIRPHNYSQVYIPSCYTARLQLRGINSHILQHVPEPLNEFSLSDILARSQDTIQELNAMRNSDSDNNIAHSIGRIIGTTLSCLTTEGSYIIRAIGSAMHDGLNGLGDLDEKSCIQSWQSTWQCHKVILAKPLIMYQKAQDPFPTMFL